MLKTVAQLVALNLTISFWNGINNSMYQTSNRLLKAFYQYGIDSALNSATIKQLYRYELTAFNQLLKTGLQFEYQGATITLLQVKRNTIQLTVVDKNGATIQIPALSDRLINRLHKDDTINKDIMEVLSGLIKQFNR